MRKSQNYGVKFFISRNNPGLNASAAFFSPSLEQLKGQVDSGKVFKEDVDMVPTIIDKSLSYMPWGGDNMMPYNILKLIEDDETLSTCQQFNAQFIRQNSQFFFRNFSRLVIAMLNISYIFVFQTRVIKIMVAIANISAQRIFDLRNTHKSLIVSALSPLRFCRAGFLQPTFYGTRWHRPARAALLREIY